MTMTQLITSLGLVSTQVISTISTVASAVVAQPVMLIGVGIGLLGAGVGIVKKFF